MNLQNCIIDGFRTNKDGSLKITLLTRELSPQQMAELIMNLNKEVMAIDIPEEPGETKSASERFRNVLYRVWEAHHKEKYPTFVLYYNHIMIQLIDMYKEKI